MDFSLSDTQREIQRLAARIFRENSPQARLRTLDNSGYFDAHLWQLLAKSGLIGLAIDEAHGGMAQDVQTLAVLLQEAGRHVAPVPLTTVLVTGAALLCRAAGQDSVAVLLRGVVRGERMLTASAHPIGATAAGCEGVTARPCALHPHTGLWTLNGLRSAVPAAPLASHAWVSAALPDGEPGVFLIDLLGPGVTVLPQTLTSGESAGQIRLEAASAQCLARDVAAADWLLEAEVLTWAAQSAYALGLCEGMTQLGVDYTSQREQFGQPIAKFQAVAHRLADAWIATECLRVASIGVHAKLAGSHPLDADVVEAAMVAKVWAADALHAVSHGVQQVHGGAGVDRDYPLFRYALVAKQTELAFGGRESLLERLGQQAFS